MGDTAWYTNMHSYRDWFNTIVDEELGAVCNQPVQMLEPPLLTEFAAGFDPTADELVVEARVLDRSELGLAEAQLRVAPLTGTECAASLATASIAASFVAPDSSQEEWALNERLSVDLGEGETVCVELKVIDVAGGEADPSVTRVSRCLDDCNGQGDCIWTSGTCECAEQWSGSTCDVCTPACDGLLCGPDGCGGTCGTCSSPPASECVNQPVDVTEDGLPVFGQGAVTSLVSYSDMGECAEGMCQYESHIVGCPEALGYLDESGVDYGCSDGRCLDRCELIDHPTLDFPHSSGPVVEPEGRIERMCMGSPPVLLFCPEADNCAGSIQHFFGLTTQPFPFDAPMVNVSAAGQFGVSAGDGPQLPIVSGCDVDLPGKRFERA